MLDVKNRFTIDKNINNYISIILLILTYSMVFIFWDLLTQYETAIFLEINEVRIPAVRTKNGTICHQLEE
jgi:hypothetical protein